MRIYYDTEFVEDGNTVDLLSIGMVREDGATLYRVVKDPWAVQRAVEHEWLRDNVVRHLPVKLLDQAHGMMVAGDRFGRSHEFGNLWEWDRSHPDRASVVSRREVAMAVRGFIAGTESPQLWAWYGAYDHVAYAQLFGRMIDLPDGFPMNTCDVKQEAMRLGDPQIPAFREADAEHNALSDARWARSAHQWLMEVERQHFRNTMAVPYSWDR